MSQVITNYEYDTSFSYEKTENVYEFDTKNKAVRIIIKLLIKLKIIKQYQRRITVNSAKQFTIDEQNIINSVCEKIPIYRYMMNKDVAGIMVGREQYGLIREDYIKSSVSTMGRIGCFHDGCKRIENIPLVLNPFIDGVVFVTNDMISEMTNH